MSSVKWLLAILVLITASVSISFAQDEDLIVPLVAASADPNNLEDDDLIVPLVTADATSASLEDDDLIVPLVTETAAPTRLPTDEGGISRVAPGFWRQTDTFMTMTGTCRSSAMGFGSGGEGGGAEPTPMPDLTTVCQSNLGDFLFVDDFPNGLLETDRYGRITADRALIRENGATVGSLATTYSEEYRIISPDLIGLHRVYQEDGGCTMETDTYFELVQADESVCTTAADVMLVFTPTAISTPVGTPPAPTETPLPIPPATYPVTWTVDSGTCTPATRPAITEAAVDYAANGDMLLRVGDEDYTLFPSTADQTRYEFMSAERQIVVSLLVDTIMLDWGSFAGMEMCFKSGELGQAGQPQPGQDVQDAQSETLTPPPPAGSSDLQLTVVFEPMEMMCPQNVRELLPNFDGAAFESLPDGNYQLAVDGEVYVLENDFGYYTYNGAEGRFDMTYQIVLVEANENGGSLGLTYIDPNGAMCLAELTLRPQ